MFSKTKIEHREDFGDKADIEGFSSQNHTIYSALEVFEVQYSSILWCFYWNNDTTFQYLHFMTWHFVNWYGSVIDRLNADQKVPDYNPPSLYLWIKVSEDCFFCFVFIFSLHFASKYVLSVMDMCFTISPQRFSGHTTYILSSFWNVSSETW